MGVLLCFCFVVVVVLHSYWHYIYCSGNRIFRHRYSEAGKREVTPFLKAMFIIIKFKFVLLHWLTEFLYQVLQAVRRREDLKPQHDFLGRLKGLGFPDGSW